MGGRTLKGALVACGNLGTALRIERHSGLPLIA